MQSAEIRGRSFTLCKVCGVQSKKFHVHWKTFNQLDRRIELQCWTCGRSLAWLDQQQYAVLAPGDDHLCSEVQLRLARDIDGARLHVDIVGTHPRTSCPRTKAEKKKANKVARLSHPDSGDQSSVGRGGPNQTVGKGSVQVGNRSWMEDLRD